MHEIALTPLERVAVGRSVSGTAGPLERWRKFLDPRGCDCRVLLLVAKRVLMTVLPGVVWRARFFVGPVVLGVAIGAGATIYGGEDEGTPPTVAIGMTVGVFVPPRLLAVARWR